MSKIRGCFVHISGSGNTVSSNSGRTGGSGSSFSRSNSSSS